MLSGDVAGCRPHPYAHVCLRTYSPRRRVSSFLCALLSSLSLLSVGRPLIPGSVSQPSSRLQIPMQQLLLDNYVRCVHDDLASCCGGNAEGSTCTVDGLRDALCSLVQRENFKAERSLNLRRVVNRSLAGSHRANVASKSGRQLRLHSLGNAIQKSLQII